MAAEIAQARAGLPSIDPAAFDCYLGDVVGSVAEWTEGDPVNVLASLICVTGVNLGQGPHVRAGDDLHPLLVWPLIVGRTNSGRKGAGWATAKRIAAAAVPDFVTHNLKSGLTSGEGLAAMFTDTDTDEGDGEDTAGPARPRSGGRLPPGDRRLLVFENEWAGVMARMRREGNALSATLRGAWEGGDLSTLAVTARIAPTSHVGIVAHITPDEFKSKVSASDLAGGTYNRFLPIMVSRSRFLPGGQGAPLAVINGVGAALSERLEQGAKLGNLGFTADGADYWAQLYVEFGSDINETGPVEQFTSRAAPNCLRIAAIHACLDNDTAITARHLAAAAALVRYSIASARAVFSHDQTAARIVAFVAADPDGRTKTQITSGLFKNKPPKELNDVLEQLVNAGQLTAVDRPRTDGKSGRTARLYQANIASLPK
ncbi:DUF3987 domain-containing protein [Amycolatopsis suaedae]|uniref:DUF3987 domain-containing protein n=2 Tax=Amycolatopsis suaedae TaxID=2510978 RepID=A0A4Q7J9M7_9PSEU|nr:DUF3987 domain-containing protein [Amycolatopsis suaedae]